MSSERQPNMKDILSVIEESAIDIERVKNLLQLYDEMSRGELVILDHVDPAIKEHFKIRYEVIDSILVSASRQLFDTLNALNKIVDDCYKTRAVINTANSKG